MTTPCGYVCDNKTSEGYCKTTGCINPRVNQIALTLNSPITEEQLDTLTDVDLDNTPSVIFQTKHGKEVEYVKVVRCKDCKRWDSVPADETQDHECHLFDGNKEKIRIATPSYWFCPAGERRSE